MRIVKVVTTQPGEQNMALVEMTMEEALDLADAISAGIKLADDPNMPEGLETILVSDDQIRELAQEFVDTVDDLAQSL